MNKYYETEFPKGTPEEPKSIDEYQERVNPTLKEHNKKIVNNDIYSLLKVALIVLGIGLIVLSYLVYDGKFQTEINCPSPQNISIPSCPSCPTIPSCPSCSNICDVNFPDSLEIKYKNETE